MKPIVKTRALLLFALMVVSVVACRQNVPQVTPAKPTAINEPPPAATAASSVRQPFDGKWDDRAVFRTGLIQAEQKVLDQLHGASVYHIDMQIADDLSSLQGRQQVRYANQETQPLDAIYFQLFPTMYGGKSAVSAVMVNGQEVKAVYESQDSTLKVLLPTPLQPGQQVVAQMDFKVSLPREMGGNYGLFGYFNNILVLDGFYPAIPAYDDTGWHAGALPPNADSTYMDASFYLVRVAAPANLTLAASGVEINRESKGNSQVVTFAAGPARDFYLAASDRFAVVSETFGETKVNSYAFKERTEGARLALRAAIGSLKSFNTRLGAYPYTEFDVVSTPMTASGIEYPGIVGINYTYYDTGGNFGGVPASVMIESVVAHEVGHQWFYNVVGNDQINEPWVDESVDQYVTGLYFLDAYGKSGYDGYRSSWVGRWERVSRASIPIGMPAEKYQGKEYGAIVYGRGPLFVEALAAKMGQATLDKFLRDYYESHKWGIGAAASFRKLAEKHCQCDLTALFDEWVYKK
jgi:hypothetical protein